MATDPERQARGGSDARLLERIRTRRTYHEDFWRPIREEGAKDMRYVAGDPWEPGDREARRKAGRPCISPDELGQHFNQLINGVRANKRAIKFAPNGGGANDKSAEWYADKTREIEYRSHAQLAYTTAFQNAVHRGYGFIRLETRRGKRSRNQDLWISAFPNPDMVSPDPDALRPDSSDMKDCFVLQTYLQADFEREWPQAQTVSFTSFIGQDGYALWVPNEQKLTVAEYWYLEPRKRTLLLLQSMNGQMIEQFADELDGSQIPQGATKTDELEVDWPEVKQCITNGVEILSRATWAGPSIPIVSCYGMVLYMGGERTILSMTRLARDPAMLHAYIASCKAEVIGGVPRNAWLGYEGQFAKPDQWQKAAHEPVVYLEAKATVDATGQQILPLPTKMPWDPPIQNLEIAQESARRSIQAAIGASPLPSQAQRRNEKSGIALQTIEDAASRRSYHFNDHYDDMIRRLGELIEEKMDLIYDSPRDVGIRKPNDTATLTRINNPTNPNSISTKGNHQVTVSTGPSYDSQREAASAVADALIASPAAPLIMDLAVKLKSEGPIIDEIADRLTPPQFRKPSEDGQPSPADVAQMQSQMQQLGQALQQLQQELATKKAETDSRERIAQAEIAGKLQLAQIQANVEADKELALQVMKNAAMIATAHIAAAAKGADIQQHAQEEAAAMGHEAIQNERDREHEAQMAQMDHAQALEQGQQAQMMMPEAGA